MPNMVGLSQALQECAHNMASHPVIMSPSDAQGGQPPKTLVSTTYLALRKDIIQGQRGFRVAAMSPSDFHDITETRIVLECQALRLSIHVGDDEWECTLTAAFHRLNLVEQRFRANRNEMFEEWESANKGFHEVLISRCGSPWTQHFLKVLYNQAERYRRVLLPNRPESRDVHAEHEAIFSATMARNEDAACDLLSSHIRYNLELYKKLDG